LDYQKLLLDHLELIDRVVHFIARRHHLSASDAEEFLSIVRFKLIDRDFAILRKFQGRSNLATYLGTVVERLYLDFCIARWGKWRPSASARKLGGVAIQLEQLMTRDGLTFAEAVGTLQTNYGVTHSREELHAIMAKLPVRSARRFAGEEELAVVATRTAATDPPADDTADRAALDRVDRALAAAMAALSPEQQLILKWRFQEGLSVVQIARLMAAEPRPIYRQIEQIVAGLRDQLDREGVDESDIARVVGHPAFALGQIFGKTGPDPVDWRGGAENDGMRPSKR
jgi:RNA polymerase sigma factor (sigma-70 family)